MAPLIHKEDSVTFKKDFIIPFESISFIGVPSSILIPVSELYYKFKLGKMLRRALNYCNNGFIDDGVEIVKSCVIELS